MKRLLVTITLFVSPVIAQCDCNEDFILDVLDIVIAVDCVIQYPYPDGVLCACQDCSPNPDGITEILDIVIIVNCIINGDCWNEESVTDIDGNIYETVQIGNQIWMAENLRVTHYQNGDEIQTGLSNSEWTNITIGAYSEYDTDPSNADIYGNLYNWYAIDDSRGIAPEEWHVATDEEWLELTEYLGGFSFAGGSMKAVGTIENDQGWWHEPNTGANNESGFAAIPGGYRSEYGYYYHKGYYSAFWSSTEGGSYWAWHRDLSYNSTIVERSGYDKHMGSSIRCVKDAD